MQNIFFNASECPHNVRVTSQFGSHEPQVERQENAKVYKRS